MRSADRTDTTVTEGVCGTAHFKVEMCSGHATSRANVSNSLARRNGLTRRDRDTLQVRVECLGAVVVCDNDVITIAAIPPTAPARDDDDTISSGMYWCSTCGAEVDAISAMNSLSEDAARHRIDKEAGQESTAPTVDDWSTCCRARANRRRENEFAAGDDNG